MDDRNRLNFGFASIYCSTRDLDAIRKCNISIDGSHEIISFGLALYTKLQHAHGHSSEVISHRINELYVRHIDPEVIDTFLDDEVALTKQVNETGELRISDELWIPESMYTDVARRRYEDSNTIRELVSMKWNQRFEFDVIEAILDHFQENQATDHEGRPVGDRPVPTQGSTIGDLPRTPVTARTGTRRSSFTRAPPLYSPRPEYNGHQFVHPREIVVGNTHHPDSFREGTCPLPPPYAPPPYADAVADDGTTDHEPISDSRSPATTTTSIANRRGASIPAISAQRPNFLEAVTGDRAVRQTLPDQPQPFDRRYPAWLPKQDYSPNRTIHEYGGPPSPALVTATCLLFLNQAALSVAFVKQKDALDRLINHDVPPSDSDHSGTPSPSDGGPPGTPPPSDAAGNEAELALFGEDLRALLSPSFDGSRPFRSRWLDGRTPGEDADNTAVDLHTLTRPISVPNIGSTRQPTATNATAPSTQQQRDQLDQIRAEVQISVQRLRDLERHFMTDTDESDDESNAALAKVERLIVEGWVLTGRIEQGGLRGDLLSHEEAVACRAFCEKVSIMAAARETFLDSTAALTGNLDGFG